MHKSRNLKSHKMAGTSLKSKGIRSEDKHISFIHHALSVSLSIQLYVENFHKNEPNLQFNLLN